MPRRGRGWAAAGIVLALAALGGFYATTTPRYALYRLGSALERHDAAAAQEYFDVEGIADRATDVIVADYLSRQPAPTTLAEVNGRDLLARLARRRLRPQVIARVRAEIRRSVEGAGVEAGPVAIPVGAVAALRAFRISREGADAWVAYRDPVQGPLRFRMSRRPDRRWWISELDPEWVRRRARESGIRVR